MTPAAGRREQRRRNVAASARRVFRRAHHLRHRPRTAGGSGGNDSGRVLLFRMHREDEDLRRQALLHDLARRGAPIHLVHREIHDDDVRFQPLGEGDRLVGSTRARYQTTGSDTVLVLRTEATRAP